ncbi:MAG: hypothetical protein QMD61_05055 [Methanobacterium sp.]|nr:hypothetical protein [Methanobacterium sp.]
MIKYKNNNIFLILLILIIMATVFSIDDVSAAPNQIYVNNDTGNDTWDGESPTWNGTSGPKLSIKNATGTVSTNGVVNVANGIYTGTNNQNITINRNMTIQGQSSTGTIIDAEGLNRIFIVNSGINFILNDLTIRNGTATNSNGGAIQNNGGTLTVNRCVFTNNKAIRTTGNTDVFGGAIYSTGTLTVTNSIFTSNTAVSGSNNEGYGGAIYNTGSSTITGSNFTNNSVNSASGTRTDDGGAIYVTNTLNVTNCTFTGNNARDGGAIWSSRTLNITGSNFVTNTAIRNGGAIWSGSSLSGVTLNVTGSNFLSNTATTNGGAIHNNAGNAEIHFNRIIGNSPSGNQIRRSGGNVNIINNWWGDNAGSTGKTSGTVTATTWLVLTITSSQSWIPTSGTSTITADLNHLNNGNLATGGSVPNGIPVTFTCTLGSVNPFDAYTINGIATTTFTGFNSGIATVNATVDGVNVSTNITVGTDIYVSPTGNDTTGDGSQGNPYKTIAKGISMVSPGGTVHVANGTYTGTGNVNLTINKNVTINGESRDSAIIDRQNLNRIFIISSGYNITLTNLTLRNGLASNSNGGAIQNNGGTLTINNCALTNNRASRTADSTAVYGGAIYNTGTLTINNSIFTGNTVTSGSLNDAFGGAIYSTGSITITGSTFSGNNATSSSGTANDDGGAIYTNGNLNIDNSSFTNNTAGQDGGAIYSNSNLSINNSSFTSNAGGMTNNGAGGAICIGDGSILGMNLTITNSTFTGNSGQHGGALWTNAGSSSNPAVITNTTFTGNTGTYGGAIRNWGILNITKSSFTGNSGTEGGAINNYNSGRAVLTVTESNLIDNTATTGGALYNDGGTAEIHFNRIIGNTGTDVYRSAGTLNAQNNWWGNNYQGSSPLAAGRVNSGANAATWLVLSIAASPNTILVGGTSTVTADLTHDQNGNYYNPASGQVPDSIPINFGGTLGSLNPASSTIINGISTSTFTAGIVPGTATVSATVDSQTVNTQIIISPKAVLTITNTANNSNMNVGQTGIFTVTVINNGPNTATNIKINDILPDGFTADTHGTGSYDGNVWTIPSLASGSSAILTFTGVLTPAMAGTTITNHATATWNEYPSTVTIPDSSIYVKKAATSITITPSNATPNVGQQFYYTITVTNNGDDDATDVNVSNNLPAGLTLNGYTASQGTFMNGEWNVGTLTKGSSATLIVYVTPQSSIAGQDMILTATKTQNEYPQTTTVSSTIHVKKADVALSQTGNYSGNKVTFVVTANNNGPDNATGLVITNPIPVVLTGVTVTPSIGDYDPLTGIWTIGTLNNGESATLTITGNATLQSTINNTATRTAQDEYNSQNITSKFSIYVPCVDISVYNTPWYYLSLEKKYQDTYVYGNVPVFMLTAWNSASYDEATGVILQYIIPNGFQYVTSNTGGLGSISYTYDSLNQQGILTWNIGYMPKGGIATAYIYLKVVAVGNKTANLTTTANLLHVDQTDIKSSNDQNVKYAIITPASADIQVNQTYTTYTENNKQYVTYTITVTNNGPSNATGVQITDKLPSGVQWVSDNSAGSYNHNTTGTGAGIWTIGNLSSEESKTLIITAEITGTGTIINTATKTTQAENDWNYNNNAQTTYLTISGNYNKSVDISVYNTPWYYLSLEKKYQDTYVYGNVPVFMLTAWNSASYDEATGVILQYIIPNGFQYVTSNTGGLGSISYTYDSLNQQGILTWNIGYMPKGGIATAYIYLKVVAVGNKTANLTTTANLLHVDQTDIKSSNDQNVKYAIITPASADIQVNQTYTTYTENNKQYVTYTITVTNNGPSNATGVQITDKLPSGVQWVSDNSAGSYNHNTTGTGAGIWTIGNLSSEESKTLIITAEITGTGTIINTATKTTQAENDWNYNNNAQTTYLIREVI